MDLRVLDLLQLIDFMKPTVRRGHGLSGQVIVSLTSYPKRFGTLHATLRSLINQTVMPDKLILWLYEQDFSSLPESVRALEQQGLEIFIVQDDWRSYKKIIPALLSFPDAYIVTADDGLFYRPTWLEELVSAHELIGGVVAHRAHIAQIDDGGQFRPYNEWIAATPPRNYCLLRSPFVFPTTGAGVLYPPRVFINEMLDISRAMILCPTSDDIWCYFMMLRSGHTASLITGRALMDIGEAGENLCSLNGSAGNDDQIRSFCNEYGVPELLSAVIRQINSIDSDIERVRLRNGQSLRVKQDHIGKIIKKTKLFYEEELVSFVKRNFAPRSVIDAGSNIGNHAVGFSGAANYRVLCFEPDEHLAEITRNNLKDNRIDGEVFTFGLSFEEDRLLYQVSDDENSGMGRFVNTASNENGLLVRSLDSCIPSDFNPDLIKIDVEGFELNVLQGAKETIRKFEPALVIECHNYKRYIEVSGFLSEFGYRALRVFCATPTFIFVPRRRFGFYEESELTTWVDAWGKFSEVN